MAKRGATSGQEPQIIDMPSENMAVVYSKGDPNEVGPQVMPALYGSVYKLKFDLKKKGIDFKVGVLRARWPDAHIVPKNQWSGIWGLPIPDDVTSLPQKVSGIEVKREVWQYGTVAQILHMGPFSTEMPTIQRLHDFIAEKGYEITGAHEEEYLTTPKAKVQKTIIRCPITKA
jgi:hypothetical protein